MLRSSSLILLFSVALTACSVVSMPFGTKNKLQQLSLVALADANQHSAFAIDVVFIYEANVIDALPTTGAAWFTEKQALMNRYGQSLDIAAFEVVPLSQIDAISLPEKHSSATAILIYANMLVEQPVIRLPIEEKCINMIIAKQSVKYDTCQ